MENPNVVRMYNKYKDKGFAIYSVSLDQSKGNWTKAIRNDNLTWTHVSDLKYWQSAAAQQYGVQAIPATFLLDKEGKIIAKNLRGDALEQKLEEILKGGQ
jgi:peroxiredoxin